MSIIVSIPTCASYSHIYFYSLVLHILKLHTILYHPLYLINPSHQIYILVSTYVYHNILTIAFRVYPFFISRFHHLFLIYIIEAIEYIT